MATGATSDLVPVRKATKQRLAELKGDASYDAALRALLDATPIEVVRSRLRPARASPAAPSVPSAAREPEEQLLIPRLAEESWRAWRRAGIARDRGERMISFFPDARGGPDEVRIAARRDRGFPP